MLWWNIIYMFSMISLVRWVPSETVKLLNPISIKWYLLIYGSVTLTNKFLYFYLLSVSSNASYFGSATFSDIFLTTSRELLIYLVKSIFLFINYKLLN